jgi:serine/threonine protein kinase/Tfp pilus assembly protein PilF
MNYSEQVHTDSLVLPEINPTTGPRPGRELASEIKSLWKRGDRPDARAALSQHPELRGDKSAILDLAYEEYCLHLEAGRAPDPDEFCERFPNFKASLRRLIEAHRFLEENSHLLADATPLNWPQPGEDFLGFTLLEELGRGAFARVFLAAEPALGNRKVAVKVSLQGTSEAETLGRINHPNIVPVHSVQQDKTSGLTVVCMPYLGSATLCDVLDMVFATKKVPGRAKVILDAAREAGADDAPVAGRRTPAAVYAQGTFIDGVVQIGAELADALACIHSLGICHRDLKPSNVLMSPDGRPMLLDFNLSFDEKIADSRLGGTLPYMSPEQLLATDLESGAGPSLIDARSDIFSLGLMLYELLTGAHPYGPVPLKLSSRNLRQHLLERHRARPRPIRDLNPQVDKKLARIIERCMAYNPNDRPQSPALLAAALRQCLSPFRRLRRWVALHPRMVAAMVLVTLTASAAGGGTLALMPPYSDRQCDRAREFIARGQYEKALPFLDNAIQAREDPQTYFLRARVHQKLGDKDAALLDYEQADKLAPSGINKACISYCLTLRREFGPAYAMLLKAIDQGALTPEVMTNLGYLYERAKQEPKDFDAADMSYARAIESDPTLKAAYTGRAVIDLKRADLNSIYVPRAGLEHIQHAINLGGTAPEFYYAALLCFRSGEAIQNICRMQAAIAPANSLAVCARTVALKNWAPAEERRFADLGFTYLAQSISMGLNPELKNLKLMPCLLKYHDTPQYKALFEITRSTSAPPPSPSLADPWVSKNGIP